MNPPIISFINFNRAGLSARNLEALLKTNEDFELYIVDNHSTDNSWDFIETLKDERIKEKKRFELNRGGVYGLNYVLKNRRPDQYFVNIDSDACIESPDWLHTFMKAFETFEDLGVAAAVRPTLFEDKNIHPEPFTKNGMTIYPLGSVIGCCLCIRPEVFDTIGYFNEETCGADIDLCAKVNKYTPYKIAIIPDVHINQQQIVSCDQCTMKHLCTLENTTCFRVYKRRYYNDQFVKLVREKEALYLQEVATGKRSPYCASIHDPESMAKYYYNKEWAEENFQFYMDHSQ